MHDIRPKKKVWSSRLTAIFLAHHTAEMHLKALGACSAFTHDGRDEYLYGNTFNYNGHSLGPLLNHVHPTVKPRLDRVLSSSGQTIERLVRTIPQRTAELFRYGLLLKDTTRHEVRITAGGDIELKGTNLSKALTELCDLLREFTRSELNVLTCPK